jgi:hypothetical protein
MQDLRATKGKNTLERPISILKLAFKAVIPMIPILLEIEAIGETAEAPRNCRKWCN